MGLIIFNNKRSDDYGIRVWSPPDYELPEKDLDVYHVPGRSGDLIIDHGSYKNVDRPYTITAAGVSATTGIPTGTPFLTLARRVAEWLQYSTGYAVLEDSYEPDMYRMARYAGTNPITNLVDQAAMIQVTFNCKPQRFLKSGEDQINITSSNYTLNNAYKTIALPIITVKGSGTVYLKVRPSSASSSDDGYRIELSNLNSSGITIKSIDQECYTESTSKNANVSLGAYGFPKLYPGNNIITFGSAGSDGGSVSRVEVLPKWWII